MPKIPKYINKTLPVGVIRKSQQHWDREFTEEDVNDLAEEIQRVGQIHPITVRRMGKGGLYEYLAGERRFTAIRRLRHPTIECRVISCDDEMARYISLSENLGSKKPNDTEWYEATAEAVKLLEDRFSRDGIPRKVGMGRPTTARAEAIKEVAKDTGTTVRTVRRAINMVELELIPSARKAMHDKRITKDQAKQLASMTIEKQRNNLPKMLRANSQKKRSLTEAEILSGAKCSREELIEAAVYTLGQVRRRSKTLVEEITLVRGALDDELIRELSKHVEGETQLDLLTQQLSHLLRDLRSIE